MEDPPALPLPARDIPANLNPPFNSGRIDVHGWLWLPFITNEQNPRVLHGWFYHHTPEFWTDSPHDFEIMVKAELTLDTQVANLPLPPQVELIGTEYVFTPPAFSLDDFITQKTTSYYGRFTNGSFDTPQRYLLSNGTLKVTDLVTVHYLKQDQPVGYTALPYYSYPRSIGDNSSDVKHLYFLHLEEKTPEFDQIIHVTVDPSSCVWHGADNIDDLIAPGATFQFPNMVNDVKHRLGPWNSAPIAFLLTEKSKSDNTHTVCRVKVLEEIHCVVVPDSFANCPPVQMN